MDRERELRRAGWRLIRGELREQRRWVIAGIGAGVIWTAAKITVPLLAAAAIDDGIIPGDGAAIAMYAALIVLVGAVQAFGTGARRYAAFRISYRVETDMRQRLFGHLQRLHFAFHDEAQTGQLMARANTDIQQIETVVILLPLTLIASVFGMNVAFPGSGTAAAFWVIVAAMVVALGGLLGFFRWKRWI